MSLIDQLKENRQRLLSEMERIIAAARAQNRNLSASEVRRFNDLEIEVREIDERIDELEEENRREGRAAELRRKFGLTGGDDPHAVYRRSGGPSFFRDLVAARHGDVDAAARLAAHRAQVEARALSTSAGAGGELAPPQWLVDRYVNVARPLRVTANLVRRQPLPGGVSSINIPKVASGSSVAAQGSQNTSVSQTDLATASVSSGIVTIAGKQVASLQLVEQSGIPLDEVIAADLLSAAAAELNRQVISGDGTSGQLRGILSVSGVNAVDFSTASPQVAGAAASDSFLTRVLAAADAVAEGIYAPPTAVIMHPRRWSWILQAVDADGRPLVTPSANYNAPGTVSAVAGEGPVGTFAGLPVYCDALIPTNLGTAQNQDTVIVAKLDELLLFETDPVVAVFDQPYADSLGVLFRVHVYAAAIFDRRPKAISVISGTGLVAPAV